MQTLNDAIIALEAGRAGMGPRIQLPDGIVELTVGSRTFFLTTKSYESLALARQFDDPAVWKEFKRGLRRLEMQAEKNIHLSSSIEPAIELLYGIQRVVNDSAARKLYKEALRKMAQFPIWRGPTPDDAPETDGAESDYAFLQISSASAVLLREIGVKLDMQDVGGYVPESIDEGETIFDKLREALDLKVSYMYFALPRESTPCRVLSDGLGERPNADWEAEGL